MIDVYMVLYCSVNSVLYVGCGVICYVLERGGCGVYGVEVGSGQGRVVA